MSKDVFTDPDDLKHIEYVVGDFFGQMCKVVYDDNEYLKGDDQTAVELTKLCVKMAIETMEKKA